LFGTWQTGPEITPLQERQQLLMCQEDTALLLLEILLKGYKLGGTLRREAEGCTESSGFAWQLLPKMAWEY
jgi:hypothetical protein